MIERKAALVDPVDYAGVILLYRCMERERDGVRFGPYVGPFRMVWDIEFIIVGRGPGARKMYTEPESHRHTRFALFDSNFRPFFLLAGLHGVVLVPVWVAVVLGDIQLSVGMESSWHADQMVYGFAAAALAGFWLTAVPDWAGATPRRGAVLAALAGLWIAGRIAMTFPGFFSQPVASAIDLAFVPALAVALAARPWRYLVLLILLALFWIGDLMMQAEFLGLADDTAGTGARLGIDAVLLMLAGIGGHSVPSFAANPLPAAGVEAAGQSTALDMAAIAAIGLFLVSEAVTEMSLATGIAALAAAVLNAARLGGWRRKGTLGSPILSVLRLGYLWLVLGLALKAAAALTDLIPEVAALHALTVGAIATMLMAVMAATSNGQAGHELRAPAATVTAAVLVSVAALLRVSAGVVPQFYTELLIGSGVAWTLAFVLFLAVYAPVLLIARTDGQTGDGSAR